MNVIFLFVTESGFIKSIFQQFKKIYTPKGIHKSKFFIIYFINYVEAMIMMLYSRSPLLRGACPVGRTKQQ